MLAVAASAMSASAQEPKSGYADAKFWDNWYLGANLGVMSKATDQAVLKNLNPEFGIRFGKWFTPSVGLSAEGNFLFGNKARGAQLTDPSLFHAMKMHLLGTLNFSNAFGGYTGSPVHSKLLVLLVSVSSTTSEQKLKRKQTSSSTC